MSSISSTISRWTPLPGTESRALVDSLRDFSAAGKATLMAEGIAVLGKCVSPTTPCGEDTGLVIGYVQSGRRSTLRWSTPLPATMATLSSLSSRGRRSTCSGNRIIESFAISGFRHDAADENGVILRTPAREISTPSAERCRTGDPAGFRMHGGRQSSSP